MYADAPAGLPAPTGAFGRLAEASAGKDTTTGHWELMGLTLAVAFPLYPDGFPPEVVEPFEREIGKGAVEQARVRDDDPRAARRRAREDGRAILYTSGDSVFQIATHEDVVPVDTLYAWCRMAREILGSLRVGRVIARPFVGPNGKYQRTHRQRTSLFRRRADASRPRRP